MVMRLTSTTERVFFLILHIFYTFVENQAKEIFFFLGENLWFQTPPKFFFLFFFFSRCLKKIQQRKKNPVVALVVFNQCGATNTNNPVKKNSFLSRQCSCVRHPHLIPHSRRWWMNKKREEKNCAQ